MASPTKEQREQRKKIEAIIKRDADYYTSVERRGEVFSDSYGHICFTPYALVDAIYFRAYIEETDHLLNMISKCYFYSDVDDKLQLFNVTYAPLFGLYSDINGLMHTHKIVNGNYIVPELNKEETINYLREKGSIGEDGTLKELQDILPILTMSEKIGITHKSALVQIDFTKPLKEIVSIVTKIKNDFDDDHNIIQTLGEYLGMEEKREVYKCDLINCEIYTEKNPKPIEGRLADALFIYDCKKFGLTNEYALNEINRYWKDVRNLFTEKMQENTRVKYLTFMTDLIDKRGYESFYYGIKLQ